MPTQRRHRGPHPEDATLFAPACEARLRQAVHDLSWLWSRGYAAPSSVKLVGDRYQLTTRQRTAMSRSACGDAARDARQATQQSIAAMRGASVRVDGFNVLTTLEVLFSGGVLLRGRDGAVRDMASMHGGYRMIAETLPAVGLLLHALHQWEAASVTILLDQPVSNSGRLAEAIRGAIGGLGLPHTDWRVEVVPDPDPILKACEDAIATADAAILDSGRPWFNLASDILTWAGRKGLLPSTPWMLDLR